VRFSVADQCSDIVGVEESIGEDLWRRETRDMVRWLAVYLDLVWWLRIREFGDGHRREGYLLQMCGEGRHLGSDLVECGIRDEMFYMP
jgi:hypothetical protein